MTVSATGGAFGSEARRPARGRLARPAHRDAEARSSAAVAAAAPAAPAAAVDRLRFARHLPEPAQRGHGDVADDEERRRRQEAPAPFGQRSAAHASSVQPSDRARRLLGEPRVGPRHEREERRPARSRSTRSRESRPPRCRPRRRAPGRPAAPARGRSVRAAARLVCSARSRASAQQGDAREDERRRSPGATPTNSGR